MSFYDDEIVRELELNKIYTERDLYGFICYSTRRLFVLCDNVSEFDVHGEGQFKVTKIYNTFAHEGRANDRSYPVPHSREKFYIVERV